MIYKKCIMTINKNNATLDEDIYLFRLDKNIELHFTIVNNKYKFEKSDLNNIIAQTNAAYFQIRLYRSDEIKYTFAIQPTQDGVAVLTITDDLINDPIEVGEYDFQISLLDADKTSMISMPIVKQQLHVCEPLVDNQAIMGRAVLGLSSLASGEIKNAFDSEGNYIREIHNDGDILSAQLINKFEEALDTNTKVSKDLATKKYVDDGINYDNKQINNKIVAMNISKHPVSCSTEIYKKPLCDIFPELLNITYNTVFRDSNSFKVNMDNFAKEYPTVKSAYNKLNINLYDENDNSIGNSYGNSINGDGLNVIFINITESLRFYAYFDKALVDGSSTTMETKNGYMTIQLLISKGDNKQEFIDKIKNLKLTLSVIRTDFLNLNNETIYTPTSDYNPATKKYVDDNKIAYTISSKVLATVPASDIKIDEPITVSNVSINGDRRYYIEFLGSKKLCNLSVSEKIGNPIMCNIGNYFIQAYNDSTNISIIINKINTADTTDTFTDLIIYEEEVKCIDNKYLETDLLVQNSISLGRIGDIGAGSSAIGCSVIASGVNSHAEGDYTTASGDFSHAEGNSTTASGKYAHAEGNSTTASGDYGSHAEGSNTIASGVGSHAEGDSTTASAYYSHAEGDSTTASGENSHAEGKYTTASGTSSHAEGDNTTASAYYSHAEGNCTTASGENSHAEGTSTIASSQNQHVQGKYNIEDTNNKYAHIVGNGEEGKNSNAHTLDWEGNAWFAGKLTQEGTPTEGKDLTTKKYVDDKVSGLPQISFNEAGELVVTINGVSKTFVPKS